MRGFTLLEIMVTVAVLGVLVTIALPRYEVFLANSRQSEAKINLGVIYSLQQTYHLKHDVYFGGYCDKDKTDAGGNIIRDDDGNAIKEACAASDTLATPGIRYYMTHAENAYGLSKTGNKKCDTNELGFQVAGCSVGTPVMRYGYFLAGHSKTGFHAIAYACSCTDKLRVYPACTGAGLARTSGASYTRPSGLQDMQCGGTIRNEDHTKFSSGDAWCMDENRRVENYRDIVEFCS